MGKDKKTYVIVDTNVIVSSLIKREGITRAVLVIFSEMPNVCLLSPKLFREEIRRHRREISAKSRIEQGVLTSFLREIENMIKPVDEKEFIEYMNRALELVNDESDASFVALALKYKPSIILTYNKSDYKVRQLEKIGVKIRTPVDALEEFGIDVKFAGTKLKKRRGFVRFFGGLIAMFRASDR